MDASVDLAELVAGIIHRRKSHPPHLALLVGLSGIDGSGKGYIADRLVGALQSRGLKVALVNLDGWLNLPSVRFDPARPAENFYENAMRLEDLFDQLILELRSDRSVHVEMDYVEETAADYRPHTYDFKDIDIIVLKGAYLYKKPYRAYFDLAVWVDCSWETALERSIARGQEGLPPEETVKAYRTIFFPAEEIHFERDNPRGTADMILPNDPQLQERGPAGG